MNIALIPARQGSKRVPNKNIRLLGERPLIQYTIDHAMKSLLIDRVVVSSDDIRILEIASLSGCYCIHRPHILATDEAKSIDVAKHAINFLHADNIYPSMIALLQPTVPFKPKSLTDTAISLLDATDSDSVISHFRVDYFHPNRMKKIVNNMVIPYSEIEIENVPRHKLPKAYYRDGAIYAFRPDLVLKRNTLQGLNVCPLVTPGEPLLNIDTMRDWHLAEIILSEVENGKNLFTDNV